MKSVWTYDSSEMLLHLCCLVGVLVQLGGVFGDGAEARRTALRCADSVKVQNLTCYSRSLHSALSL
jgi:hypothetical protein